MHILCLHGLGTTSHILEVQTAAIRHELDDSHTYDYVEGTIPYPIDPALAPYFPDEEEGYAFFDPSKPKTLTTALDNLEAFIASEGPFDAILAFSHGAQLAATLLVERGRQAQSPVRSIRCAIFLSGGIPYYSAGVGANSGVLPPMAKVGGEEDEEAVLHLPTTHVWGQNETRYPGTSEVLSRLCKQEWRAVFIHAGGHEIPGFKSHACLAGAVGAIKQTMHLAVSVQ
ncbi:hypothetical protein BO78DRAFT_310716 [Aspergillus sclerotiicarbonarius CBS 121057]|uniref:Serine hydrolase domain-containing protein n=1 Tax=Aspergillus sclerotiicarbonarius (strain CBS 121057 / IBT 28362) TaxID=1448318 RepID=A0A319EFN7_ASPSB|nr:hypothetical protein BO78DRAFT_310716 [Aspergillus sclerotiicarbonarius CBS 121057]